MIGKGVAPAGGPRAPDTPSPRLTAGGGAPSPPRGPLPLCRAGTRPWRPRHRRPPPARRPHLACRPPAPTKEAPGRPRGEPGRAGRGRARPGAAGRAGRLPQARAAGGSLAIAPGRPACPGSSEWPPPQPARRRGCCRRRRPVHCGSGRRLRSARRPRAPGLSRAHVAARRLRAPSILPARRPAQPRVPRPHPGAPCPKRALTMQREPALKGAVGAGVTEGVQVKACLSSPVRTGISS